MQAPDHKFADRFDAVSASVHTMQFIYFCTDKCHLSLSVSGTKSNWGLLVLSVGGPSSRSSHWPLFAGNRDLCQPRWEKATPSPAWVVFADNRVLCQPRWEEAIVPTLRASLSGTLKEVVNQCLEFGSYPVTCLGRFC